MINGSKSTTSNTYQGTLNNYLDNRHSQTLKKINFMREEKKRAEEEELRKRNYLTNFSRQIIRRMESEGKDAPNKISQKKKENDLHEEIREKSYKRVVENFKNCVYLSTSMNFDIATARRKNLQEKINNNDKNRFDYCELFPKRKVIEKFYEIALRKEDTLPKSYHNKTNRKPKAKDTFRPVKKAGPRPNSYREHQLNKITYNKERGDQPKKPKPACKNYCKTIEEKRKEDTKKFCFFFKNK